MSLPARQADTALPPISVVIPSYNRRESLVEVLEALDRQNYPLDRCDVTVVLDGSDDGSREALGERAWPFRLNVLWQPNQGAGRARNRGAATALGELLAFVDDDVVPSSGWLAAHARLHAERPEVAVVLGCMDFVAPQPTSVIVAWEAEWYARHFVELGVPEHVFSCWDFFAGNVSIKRDVFQAIGGFDEAFTNYGCEDWELGLRLLKAGHRFAYCAEARAQHRYRLDFDGWQRHAYWDGRSEVRFARKYPEIKSSLQLGAFYHGSARRRLGRHLLTITPGAWRHVLKLGSNMYLAAERRGYRTFAARLAKIAWTYHYWSGMRDELGGAQAAGRFVGFRVPILVYHRVTNRPHPALTEFAVSPATFRRQLRWLRATGHQVISLAHFYDAYRGAGRLPRKAVAITFDDGYQDTLELALPVLREFGYPATVFVVAANVGGQNVWDAEFGPPPATLMTWEQIRAAATSGFEIGAHSATHSRLPRLHTADLDSELDGSRAAIERHVRQSVAWFAFPYGEHDERVRTATRAAGYLAAFGFDGGLAGACDDLYVLPRIPVNERDGVLGLAVKLATGDDGWTAIKRRTPASHKALARWVSHQLGR